MNRFIQTTLRLSLAAAILAAAAVLPQSAAAKDVRYVKTTAGGNGDGTSWGNASDDLQAMINEGDEVWVAAGTYYPKYTADGWNGSDLVEGTAPRDRAFVLKAGVKVYGGFPETGTPDFTDRDWETNVTTLSGEIGTAGDADNCYHVVISAGADVDDGTVLDGFTVSGGNANGSDGITVNGAAVRRTRGGGIYTQSSSPELTNLIISGNKTGNTLNNMGGGIYNRGVPNAAPSSSEHSYPVLTNVTISGNEAPWGGGIGNTCSSPVLKHVTISENTAIKDNSGKSGGGGGIYNQYSSPTLEDVVISKNTAVWYGGGIYNGSGQEYGESSPVLTYVTISENTVKGGEESNADGYGGGIYNAGYGNTQCKLTLSHVTIINNKVINGFGGGIASQSNSSSKLTDVTISGNSASDNGGGIYNDENTSCELENVIISGNYAEVYGGGIYNNTKSFSNLTNVTVSGNYAVSDGGGICNDFDSYASTVTNTIVWGNGTGEDGNDPNVYNHVQGESSNTSNTYEHSLVGGVDLADKGEGNFAGTTDPMFMSPVAPSPTPTTDGDYHLYKSSPLVENNGESYLGAYQEEEDPFYYGIDLLNPTEPYNFGQKGYNYVEKPLLTAKIKNTGTQPTGKLKISRSGANAASFAITDNAVEESGIDGKYGEKTFNVAPVAGLAVGTYDATVTVTVVGDASISQSFTVTFKVTKATPNVSDLDYDLTDSVYTYTGKPQTVPVKVKDGIAGFGAITVKYDGSTDLPVAAGTYKVTADIADGKNYDAYTDLPLGNLVIGLAEPVAGNFDYNLANTVYIGKPLPISVTAADTVVGMGEITVKYNGLTRVPEAPGAYVITVDITVGENYLAIEDLLLGTFTVYGQVLPGAARSVQIPSVTGVTTNPPAGRYFVDSGEDFTFKLTLASPQPGGTLPAVRTNRTDLPDEVNIRVTAEAGIGSYTVVVRDIRQNIAVDLSAISVAGSEYVADALAVYAVPGAIAVANARSEAATVRIYTLAGALVRHATAAPGGTTHLSVAPGVYIVAADGVRWKTAVTR